MTISTDACDLIRRSTTQFLQRQCENHTRWQNNCPPTLLFMRDKGEANRRAVFSVTTVNDTVRQTVITEKTMANYN